MMKKIMYAFLLISIISCAPTKHFITNINKDETVVNDKSKSILIAGNQEVVLKNFKKTFKKNYESNEVFLKSYVKDFEAALKLNKIYSISGIDLSNKWSLLEIDTIKNKQNVSSLFSEIDSDYLMYFKDFVVDNYIVSSYSSGFGPGAMGTHNSTEYCTVTTTVVIYDVKTKKQILEFESTGESSVFLFDFTKTFLKAREKSILNAVEYLKTGKTS